MEKNITFAPNVLLLDTAFINDTVYKSRQFLSERLGRELPETDLIDWLICLGLDGGLRGQENELQVLLVADETVRTLNGCTPTALADLDGNACRTSLGEFTFAVVPSAGLVPRSKLYNELVQLALDAKEVERLMLVPHFYEYGEDLGKTLREFCEEKQEDEVGKALCFLMEETHEVLPCKVDLVTFSLMHIWGIAPDDL